MEKINIPQYPQYELHYSNTEQLIYSKKSGKYLKNVLNNKGYYQVRLYNSEGVKTWYLHRIVWVCMNGDIPEKLQVNHINEIKSDNRIDNLNLMTPKENIEYSQSKAIVGINKKTLDVIEFASSYEAMRFDKKFHHANISTCCQHKERKTVNGYYWFYKTEFNQLIEKFNGNIQDIINYKLSLY